MKTGNESIEAIMSRRRVLFAGFVARKEDTRLSKCVMFGELVGGAGCVGGQENKWMGCLLDDLRSFGIKADQWMTAAQYEGEWHKTAEQGAKRFIAKWIAAEKTRAGLWHAAVCPNVTGITKERMAQTSVLVLVRSLLLSIGHKWRLPMPYCLFLAFRFFLVFSFVFIFLLSLNPQPFVQSFFNTVSTHVP